MWLIQTLLLPVLNKNTMPRAVDAKWQPMRSDFLIHEKINPYLFKFHITSYSVFLHLKASLIQNLCEECKRSAWCAHDDSYIIATITLIYAFES